MVNFENTKMKKNNLYSIAISIIFSVALINSGCSDDSNTGVEDENTTYEQINDNSSDSNPSDTDNDSNEYLHNEVTQDEPVEDQDINTQLSEDEMTIPTEESMREDCEGYAKEDGIAESDIPAYLESCIQDLKTELQKEGYEKQSTDWRRCAKPLLSTRNDR